MDKKEENILPLKKFGRFEDGYVLIYVLFINLLIISALLSFMSLMFFYNRQSIRILTKTKLDWACYSAVQIAASNFSYSSDSMFVICIDSLNVNVYERQYGLFLQITASVKCNKDSSLYQSYWTSENVSSFDNALTISHPNTTVTVAGETHMTGNLLLTSNNISRGNIFGIRNSNESYLDGKVLVEDSIKPNIFNAELIKKLFDFADGKEETQNPVMLRSTIIDRKFISNYPNGQNFIVNGDMQFTDSLYNNSYNSYNFIVSGKVDFATNCLSTINMTVKSNSNITIGNKTHIENALLVSNKKITISISSLKNIQTFSKDTISISDAYFSYPSVIVSYSSIKDSTSLKRLVSLKGSIVNGTVMLLVPETGIPANKSKIFIDAQSKIQGIVYSENNVEISGDVLGSVYAYNFWYYKEPGEYINWLVNTHINRMSLDKWFLPPIGFNESKGLDLLNDKWIY